VAEAYTRAAVGATHGAVRGVVTLIDVVRCKQWRNGKEQHEEECESAHGVRQTASTAAIATGMPFPWLGVKPKDML